MRSIRNQLVGSLAAGVVLLTIASGVGLYTYMEEVLEHGLDAALAAKAEAIAGSVHIEDDGQPHLQLSEAAASATTHDQSPFYFQLWRADGSVLARFAPSGAGAAPLPTIAGRKRFHDAKLPDDTTARITQLSFTARPDEDEFDGPRPTHVVEQLTLVVAHDRRSVDGPLAVLLTGLLVSAAVVIGGILVIVTSGVRYGLRPLAVVSSMADKIGPDSLDVRFPGPGELPPELVPIGSRLNQLLDRLQAAFARERNISAAVAHELRTPLAELQSLCEVTLRWPDNGDTAIEAVAEALSISKEMHGIVENLMLLARCQAGVERPQKEAIRLAACVAKAWKAVRTKDDRCPVPHIAIKDEVQVAVDPRIFAVVLRNLLANVAENTPPDGVCRFFTRDIGPEVTLHIGNTSTSLLASDLPYLTEAFWRKDAARTGGSHAGLGLAIVEAYCRAAEVPLDFQITNSWFEVILHFPKPDYLTLAMSHSR